MVLVTLSSVLVPAQSVHGLQCPAVDFTTLLSAIEAPGSPCLDSLMGEVDPWKEGRKEERKGGKKRRKPQQTSFSSTSHLGPDWYQENRRR